MTRGKIKIVGNAGMHLGAYMKGREIGVTGNASDWIGAETTGGLIRVSGNAGGQIGAAYRGSLAGMKGGMNQIGGTASLEVGILRICLLAHLFLRRISQARHYLRSEGERPIRAGFSVQGSGA